MSRFVFVLTLMSISGAAAADPIYRHVDASGRVTYGNTPVEPGAKPADLPKVQKENFTQKVSAIEQAIPETCDKHGGVDCSQGADADGSVICLDGFRNVHQTYEEMCTTAALCPS